MKTPLHNLKAQVEQKIKEAKEMNTTHWSGVVAGLEDVVKEIDKSLELEKRQKYSDYADGLVAGEIILQDDQVQDTDLESDNLPEAWFNKKYTEE